MNIYISNISFHTTEEIIREMFSHFGFVSRVNIVTDEVTGIHRGFGFVEMLSIQEAQEAINKLNGKEIQSRSLRVSRAKERFNDRY